MKVFLSDDTSGTASFGSDPESYVARGVHLTSTGTQTFYLSHGGYMTVDGVIAASHIAVRARESLTLRLGNEGSLVGDVGLDLAGGSQHIENRGAISAWHTAISVKGGFLTIADQIYNSGDMFAIDGIVHGGRGALTVHNSGLIDASTDAFRSTIQSTGVNKLYNTGELIGDVRLGGGDDLYSGAKGHLDGQIFGDIGNDKIIGGADDDRIHGGDGLDVLTGGLGEDTFYFDTSVNGSINADMISDFDPDDDMLALAHNIFGLSAGKLKASSFIANSTGQAADTGDHFIYNTTNGDLYFDADGKGGNAAELLVTLKHHPTITAADFLVI